MDYIDAATTETLSPHILPIMDLRRMLCHIEETLPSTLHLPVSSEDTLHFYQYLCTHVLITNKQFLLPIDIPIQDRSQQLSIHKIFTLDIPHGNFLQLTMISMLNSSESCNMKLWQWKSHHNSSEYVEKQMDSLIPFLHHFSCWQTHHLVLQLFMLRIQPVSQPDVHYRSEKLQMSVCSHSLYPMFGF